MSDVKKLPLIQEVNKVKPLPIKVLQFGEGNFLRAFVDWIINSMNKKGVFNGGVAVVQPMPFGRCKELKEANCLYTLYLQGLQDGKAQRVHEVINAIQDALNPFEEYEKYLKYAESPELEFVISNTTEAGIAFDPEDTDFSSCPKSYPGKLLAFLERRYNTVKKGLFIIPCELIDHNGETLKEVLVKLARHCNKDEKFVSWIENENRFYNTLVDRIVPGYPRNEADQFQQELGYQDNNMVVGEIFHLWCLDAQTTNDKELNKKNLALLKENLPTEKAGLNVLFVDSIVPYKQRKVKILNGSHTTLVPVSYLSGIDTVRETIEDEQLGKFVKEFIFNEVIPTIDIPHDQMVAYSNSVLERYMNPYVRHELMSIALNSCSKYKERVLPTVLQYIERKNELPKHALFSLASLMVFYRGIRPICNNQVIDLKDDPKFIEMFKELWANYENTKEGARKLVKQVLGLKEHWGCDLNQVSGVTDFVSEALFEIVNNPEREALKKFF